MPGQRACVNSNTFVARMEPSGHAFGVPKAQSGNRDADATAPDFAALHPGYAVIASASEAIHGAAGGDVDCSSLALLAMTAIRIPAARIPGCRSDKSPRHSAASLVPLLRGLRALASTGPRNLPV